MVVRQTGPPIASEASGDSDPPICISPAEIKSKSQKGNKGDMIATPVDSYVRTGITDGVYNVMHHWGRQADSKMMHRR
jgi:hypothetical protein